MCIKMDYVEALRYIEGLAETAGSVYSITEAAALSDRVGRPDRKLKIIHIAGTNGKGSVSNFICGILAMSGYIVGKYISPTLFEYRERIQKVYKNGEEIASEYISKEMTAEKLSELRAVCDEMVKDGFSQPTAFEIETVLAFLAFCEWNVDYVVVETGLGGMMDATNIIEHPLQCIITSLSLEHQKILGDSIIKIAKEKYGIIKKNAQVISAKKEECIKILEEQVKRKKAVFYPVLESDIENVNYTQEATNFSYRGEAYSLKQLGTYQPENAVLAIESALHLKELGAEKITGESIKEGLKNSFWRGRFEIVSEEPYIFADGAHNLDAVKRLKESLEVYFKGETMDFVFGVLEDKNYKEMIEELLPYMHRVYTVTPPVKRGLPAEKLQECIETALREKGEQADVQAFDSVKEAVKQAAERAEGKRICICGSLYILGEAYRQIESLLR